MQLNRNPNKVCKIVCGTLSDLLNLYRKMQCLIIDDWLNDPISTKETLLMKKILDYREKYGGTLLIFHSTVSEWEKTFL